MSRSGYSEDGDHLNLYRGSVQRAIDGKRGQAFLAEMAAALDAMEVKELIAEEIVADDGQVCAIGAVARARRLDVAGLDVEDGEAVGKAFGIARSMACEIAYENEETDYAESPAERWGRMRRWVQEHLL